MDVRPSHLHSGGLLGGVRLHVSEGYVLHRIVVPALLGEAGGGGRSSASISDLRDGVRHDTRCCSGGRGVSVDNTC